MSRAVTFQSAPCSYHQAKTNAMNCLKKHKRTLNKAFDIHSRLKQSPKLKAVLSPPCLNANKIESAMTIVSFQLDNMHTISQFSDF